MTSRMSPATWTNWGGNQSVAPQRVVKVTSAREVSGVITDAIRRGHRVKAVGSGHSFSAIAVPADVQLTLEASGALVSIDAGTGRAEAPACFTCTASTGCWRSRGCPCRTSATSRPRPWPGRSLRVPTAPARPGRVWRRRSEPWRWCWATARSSPAARSRTRTCSAPPASGWAHSAS